MFSIVSGCLCDCDVCPCDSGETNPEPIFTQSSPWQHWQMNLQVNWSDSVRLFKLVPRPQHFQSKYQQNRQICCNIRFNSLFRTIRFPLGCLAILRVLWDQKQNDEIIPKCTPQEKGFESLLICTCNRRRLTTLV